MEIKIIRKEEGVKRKINENYEITNFLTKDNSKDVSFAISDAKNHKETTKNVKSERIYFVLEGKIIIDKELIAEGEGLSKQEAEEAAAKKALEVKKWG